MQFKIKNPLGLFNIIFLWDKAQNFHWFYMKLILNNIILTSVEVKQLK